MKVIWYIGIALLILGLVGFALTPEPIEKSIIVNQAKYQVELYEDGKLITSYPSTSGKLGSLTKTGSFHILSKEEDVAGIYGNFPLWVGVYTVRGFENGIHSIEGENEWEECIGVKNCTPGSIILYPDDMKDLYEWVEVGTSVVIESI